MSTGLNTVSLNTFQWFIGIKFNLCNRVSSFLLGQTALPSALQKKVPIIALASESDLVTMLCNK
jgi:hypothetical protein